MKFVLPDELYEKIEILEGKSHWDKLSKDIKTKKLTSKEVIVIRIYFTFLNFKNTLLTETDNP